MIDTLVRNEVKQIKPVIWGDISEDCKLRLLWGENPLFPRPAMIAVRKEVNRINQYPSPTQKELKKLLADYNKVELESIILTNGSDDALELIAKVFLTTNDEVIIPIPTFPCYETVSQMMGATIRTIALNSDFSLPPLKETITPKTKIIWIANPNNPTGNVLLQPKDIELLAQKTQGLLVVDECYFELCGISGVSLVRRYPNILVVRSFSKAFGLAGVRLGYIIADPQVIWYLRLLQANNQAFAMNRLAIAAGTALLRDTPYRKQYTQRFNELKRAFEEKLNAIPGLTVLPTQTTFCLIRITKPGWNAKLLKRELEQQYGIFVKDCSIYQNLAPSYFCLGIPKKSYQRTAIQAFKALLCQTSEI